MSSPIAPPSAPIFNEPEKSAFQAILDAMSAAFVSAVMLLRPRRLRGKPVKHIGWVRREASVTATWSHWR